MSWRVPTEASSVAWNRPVYEAGRRDHLESFFFKGNLPDGRAFWIKFTIWAPDRPGETTLGEAWVVLFDPEGVGVVGAKESWPIERCRVEHAPPRLEFGPCVFEDGATHGRLRAANGTEIRWELRFPHPSEVLVPYPYRWMYTAKLPKTKTVTPHPDVPMSGEIHYGDQVWSFEGIPGMQGHNWGTEHAPRYAWVHANRFDEPGVVFEGFSARVRIAGRLTPPLSMGFLRLPDGTWLRFDGLRAIFSRRITIEDTLWRFELRSGGRVLRGTASSPPERMAGLHYRNPDGKVLYCLNAKIADLELELEVGGHRRRWRAERGAALETLTEDPGHPVEMLL